MIFLFLSASVAFDLKEGYSLQYNKVDTFDNSQVYRVNDSLRVTRLSDKHAIPYWVPSDTQFTLLIENVEIIIQHEDAYDTADSSKEERQFFLSDLKQWSKRTYDLLYQMVNSSGLETMRFYYKLREFVKNSDAGNFSELQSSLLTYWQKHGGEIKPFWTQDVVQAYLDLQKQLAKNSAAVTDSSKDSASLVAFLDNQSTKDQPLQKRRKEKKGDWSSVTFSGSTPANLITIK